MGKRLLIAVATAAVSAGVLAPVAAASDQSVYDAYVSRDAAFARLGKAFKRGERIWERSGFRRPGPAVKAARKTQKLVRTVVAAIRAQQPSTSAGKRGKAAALRSLRALSASLAHARHGIALARRNRARSTRELRRASDLAEASLRAEKDAMRAFRRAGVRLG